MAKLLPFFVIFFTALIVVTQTHQIQQIHNYWSNSRIIPWSFDCSTIPKSIKTQNRSKYIQVNRNQYCIYARHLIRNAFNLWLKKSSVIAVEVSTRSPKAVHLSFKNINHYNRNEWCVGFLKSTLAHAAYNFIHFNKRAHWYFQINSKLPSLLSTSSSPPPPQPPSPPPPPPPLPQPVNLENRNKTIPRYDFYTTLVHEIGHVLGLGHTEHSDSIMYYTYKTKNNFNYNINNLRELINLNKIV